MMKYLAIYLLLGAIWSIVMYINSKERLSIGREIKAHTVIAIFWPVILFNVLSLMFKPEQ